MDLDRKLEPLQAAVAAAEARLPELQAQINERLGVLGQREQALGQLESELSVLRTRVDQLRAEGVRLTPQLQQAKAELGQAENPARRPAADPHQHRGPSRAGERGPQGASLDGGAGRHLRPRPVGVSAPASPSCWPRPLVPRPSRYR